MSNTTESDSSTDTCANCERETETNALGLCIVCDDAREEGRLDPEAWTDE